MTSADLNAAISSALNTVPFTPPLSVAYCVAVKAELAKRAPGASLDVYFTRTKFAVSARLGEASSTFELPLS